MMILLATAALAWTPTDAEAKLVRALSAHDGAPSCESVEADLPDPVGSLTRVVDHVEMPPWAPMAAANCLVARHSAEAATTLQGWVVDPEKRGLAKLVVNRLHLIDPTMARDLATRALDGPHRDHVQRALARSPSPEIQALAGEPASR